MPHITGLYIAIPAYGMQMHGETHTSLMTLSQLLSSQGIKHMSNVTACAEIEELRNLFVTRWYYGHSEFSHLLFVDADMAFSPYMVWDMICFDKPIVGCLYSKREFPISVVGKAFNDTDTIDDTINGHLKVEGVGGGVLLIQRKVIDAMLADKDRFPDFADKTFLNSVAGVLRALNLPCLLRPFDKIRFPGGGKLSEDLSFCRKWIDMGGEVWANVHHPVKHIGQFDYTIRYAEHLEAKKAAQEAAATDHAPDEPAPATLEAAE